ncbi:MAG: sigma 54-interacting transcriptional regulator [Myxococcales bacterium]|nr:sigma 54-interacting transcriptional regulator [Myxococcota bacterium]MDW8281066.1 sigma 54-interacting transcriptional regulator [Myxococcales bacterium]
MACLRVQPHGGGGTATVFRLHKQLTTIGAGPDNDIVLSDPLLPDTQAYIQHEPDGLYLYATEGAVELLVNGRRRHRHRLADGDTIRMGATELLFSLTEPPPPAPPERRESLAVPSLRRLYELSERLLGSYELDEILDNLLDTVIEITRADKGFLVLLEDEQPRVRVARNMRRETLGDPSDHLSDSIVAKVLATGRPIIVSDALHDQEFQNAQSVLRLKLSSVMCVPLLERGHAFGAIYVGNDSVRDLFVQQDLEVLTVLAAQASLLLRNALLVRSLRLESQQLSAELARLRAGAIVGSCPAMQEVLRKVHKVAGTDVSVLITGETGTGKELIAREIHARSPRARGPFVAINCGAIPEPLLESELFGHVRGAFTGAVASKPGRFQAASGGTILLDEIGEMPPALQVKLLRVLQEHVVVRVGDNRPEPVDIRVLAATHRDLLQEIRAGRFREDLYYRLNVVQIHLPPLRERGDDILLLAKYLVRRFSTEMGLPHKNLSPQAAAAIRRAPWPGNVRQLENHIKKALVLSEGALLTPEDLGLAEEQAPRILPLAEARERFQRNYIQEVLALNQGNRTKTARDLGVDPRTIFRYLEKEDPHEEDL